MRILRREVHIELVLLVDERKRISEGDMFTRHDGWGLPRKTSEDQFRWGTALLRLAGQP
jgi:hypothetical protein